MSGKTDVALINTLEFVSGEALPIFRSLSWDRPTIDNLFCDHDDISQLMFFHSFGELIISIKDSDVTSGVGLAPQSEGLKCPPPPTLFPIPLYKLSAHLGDSLK